VNMLKIRIEWTARAKAAFIAASATALAATGLLIFGELERSTPPPQFS